MTTFFRPATLALNKSSSAVSNGIYLRPNYVREAFGAMLRDCALHTHRVRGAEVDGEVRDGSSIRFFLGSKLSQIETASAAASNRMPVQSAK